MITTALQITNIRWCMRGRPGQGIWYQGVADLRAPHRPGDPDGWDALIEQIRCNCHHVDSQAAAKCAREIAGSPSRRRGASRAVLTTRPRQGDKLMRPEVTALLDQAATPPPGAARISQNRRHPRTPGLVRLVPPLAPPRHRLRPPHRALPQGIALHRRRLRAHPAAAITPPAPASQPAQGRHDMTRKPAAGSTYSKLVRTFDHAHLARLPAYQALRQALSDLGNQFNADERPREQPTTLDDFLGAIRDMALTAPTPTAVSTATTATAT